MSPRCRWYFETDDYASFVRKLWEVYNSSQIFCIKTRRISESKRIGLLWLKFKVSHEDLERAMDANGVTTILLPATDRNVHPLISRDTFHVTTDYPISENKLENGKGRSIIEPHSIDTTTQKTLDYWLITCKHGKKEGVGLRNTSSAVENAVC